MPFKTLLIAAVIFAFGAMPVAAGEPKDTKAKPAAEKKAETKSSAQIDINRAKAEELMTLDGIGEARAKAIIKGRPYRAKDELVDKKILPESVYEKIKERIIAHQVAKK